MPHLRFKLTLRLAGKALLKMMKRWPLMISKCVLSLTENLRNPNSLEYAVLGSCAVLSSQTVLKHLTTVSVLDKVLIQILLARKSWLSNFSVSQSRIQRLFLHLSSEFFQGNFFHNLFPFFANFSF